MYILHTGYCLQPGLATDKYFSKPHYIHTPKHVLYCELVWCMPRYIRWVNVHGIVRVWNRLILMPEDQLVKRILCWDWEICHNNWCADVKEILEELELEYCFNEMCSVDINMFRNLMILRSKKQT